MMRVHNGSPAPGSSRFRSAALIAVLGAIAHAPASHAEGEWLASDRDGLRSLNQLVRHFDFEEADSAPFEMPLNFYRYGADEGGIGHGFPPFGSMRLTRDVAYSGTWSFVFDLDGGSMAARVPSAVIPVMPGAEYTVATRVRTDELTHARARLVAWFYDKDGRMIPGSRSESRLVNTNGTWQTIAATVRRHAEHATDLGLELQLLQPAQFTGDPGDQYTPMHADVRGRAFFDDVTVWQQPRIMITTGRAGNVIVHPEQPQLTVEVHDVVHKQLDAVLRIYDIHGEVVFEEQFPAPRSPRRRIFDLPLDSFGWYRAALDILLEDDLAARRWTDLAYLPAPHRSGVGQHHRFTLALPDTWQKHDDVLTELIRNVGIGSVILPTLTRSMTRQSAKQWYERSRKTIEDLRSEHIELTFSMESLPHEIGRELDMGEDEVLLALEHEPAIWRDYLDDLIVNYSFEVSRWQIGRTGSDTVAWIDDAPNRIDRAATILRRLVPGGSVLLPTSAVNQPAALPEYAAYHIALPNDVTPANVGEYVKQWLDDIEQGTASTAGLEEAAALFTIEPAPPETYAHIQRATDLMLRVLHAWRAGAQNLSMMPPWTSSEVNGDDLSPEELLPVWRQLMDQLRGRRIVGELAIGRGIHCWLLEGVDRDDAAMVAWSEPGTSERGFEMQLADSPVTITDGFGNRQSVPLRREIHAIDLDHMPRFIEGINLELVQFRGGFAIDPPFLPVEARIHEHEVVLRNPWPMPINGTIRLREKEGMTFSPRAHRFSIPAGGEHRMRVEIQLARGIMAGPKRIKADVSLTADGQYELMLFKDVTVGLEYIDFSATSRTRHNPETGEDDLIITQYITNTGNRPLNVEAFMLGQGVPHERRLIAGLNPSEMAIRVFIIPDGANRLAGERLRVGVIERDGIGRLNQMIHVPER